MCQKNRYGLRPLRQDFIHGIIWGYLGLGHVLYHVLIYRGAENTPGIVNMSALSYLLKISQECGS